MPETSSLLVRGARIVAESPTGPTDPTGSIAPGSPADLRIGTDRVTEIAPDGVLDALPGERVIDADGRWIIPGLWDRHVHMTQWAESAERLDLSGTPGPAAALEHVERRARQLDEAGIGREQALMGVGFRAAEWHEPASVRALDAVTGERPAVLISGDAHSGWLNSAALSRLGLAPRETPLDEGEWFDAFPRVADLPTTSPDDVELHRRVLERAAAAGVVGFTDFEFGSPMRAWPERVAAGLDLLRVRAGFYAHDLDAVLAAGLRTGDPLGGLVSLGPLKIISDGSLGTLTAYCCEPYGSDPEHPRGRQNVDGAELRRLLSAARAGGLEVALHALGDLAVVEALAAFEATGARGSIEHAQLMRREDVPRMASLGLTASVQPAHLLDDREATARVWGDRADRCFMLRTMHDAGVELALGSDAPVAPLDPWLAIDAAARRARPGESPWHPEERLTAAEALFASTDGQGPVAAGAPADVVLLDHDPLTASAREVGVAATVVAGRVVYGPGF